MQNRVVVTGVGLVSPIGNDIDTFWSNLKAGVSGVGPITKFDTSTYDTRIAAEVKDFDPTRFMDRKEARVFDRFIQFAVAATSMAVEDAKLDFNNIDRDRAGVILGVGMGGIETYEQHHELLLKRGPGRISPFFVPKIIANMAPAQIAITYRLRGYNYVTTSACASGSNAVGDAFRLLRQGRADLMICGGAEAAITPLALAGFCSMKALSTRNGEPEKASRPFDAQREGFVIAEGSAILVLETLDHAIKRGARIYAEVAGYGVSCDAYHIAAPDPEGAGAVLAMQLALEDAELAPDAVNYINAHGTGTPLGDKVETMAIKRLFGSTAQEVAVSSTKSMTGHLLGAAGGLEAAVCVLAIENSVVPPTINLDYPDPECDLDYVPGQAREMQVEVALSNSFGFGGHNVTLIFKKFR